ncbi:MAG TPA: glycosyltransferase family 4 protein [Thermoleophilaceae bacterium]|jgi:colanic acid biosynthesis glycosyl transferase WcaI|nr:glycosyltransferase family 4 protein [Thermoleophilaceae bacterium]
MRLQLWSYNYAPEVTGIAPVSEVWAKAMMERGHDVEVVAAWPHYPEPKWEHPRRPYREVRDGIPVTRLPLLVGRANTAQRIRQELSFAAAQTAAIPALERPDVMIAASPSFPALAPAVLNARLRRVPWVLWLHDILPDGAAATGLVDDGPVLRAARALERIAYREADRIVVLSQAFTRNLEAKGVPSDKIELIYDPATRVPQANGSNGHASNGHTSNGHAANGYASNGNGSNGNGSNGNGRNGHHPTTLLSMGNIGFSQGLTEVVRAFESEPELNPGVRLVITGSGVAAPDAAQEIRTERVEMAGLVSSEQLEHELHGATIALVTQKHGGEEFNIPSKLMNFMMYGLPVLASVDTGSEVARIVEASGGGWVVDNADPNLFAKAVREITESPDEIVRRGAAAGEYAAHNFNVDAFAAHFDDVLRRVVRS